MRSRAEPVEGISAEQGESPRWDRRGDRLLWVDMARGRFHVGRFQDGSIVPTLTVELGDTIGFASPLPEETPGWVCTGGRDVVYIDPAGGVRPIVTGLGAPGTHFNDGSCDPRGILWAGTQSQARVPDAALFTLDADAVVRVRLTGVTVSNGLGFTADGARMYYIDTLPHRSLDVFDVIDGELSGRRTIATIDGGNPDGLAVDVDEGVWVAVWDAGEVRRFDRTGRVTNVVQVPARRPSAVCLMGTSLVITTARWGLTEPTSDDGRFFVAEVEVPGRPADAWRPSPEIARELAS